MPPSEREHALQNHAQHLLALCGGSEFAFATEAFWDSPDASVHLEGLFSCVFKDCQLSTARMIFLGLGEVDSGVPCSAESAEDFEHYSSRFKGLFFNLMRKLQNSPEVPPKTISDLEDLLAKCEYHRSGLDRDRMLKAESRIRELIARLHETEPRREPLSEAVFCQRSKFLDDLEGLTRLYLSFGRFSESDRAIFDGWERQVCGERMGYCNPF